MASLLDLPNELLIIILYSIPDAQTGARLSQINKRFSQLWDECSNQILASLFQRDLIAYDQALILAKAELLLEAEHLETTEIDMRQLVPSLMASQEMMARVLPLYKHHFDTPLHHDHVYNAETTAQAYLCGRFVALAHDNTHMRRGVRRCLKHYSVDELNYHMHFLDWFVDELAEQDIRDWHDLGLRDDEDDRAVMYGLEIPMRWHFTRDTVVVQLGRQLHPHKPIGEDGLWSNRSCQGFQRSWW